MRLAIGAGANIFFANLRPSYQFALYGPNILAYAFSRPSDGTYHMGFWDSSKVNNPLINTTDPTPFPSSKSI